VRQKNNAERPRQDFDLSRLDWLFVRRLEKNGARES
jgi:hypothetical protein